MYVALWQRHHFRLHAVQVSSSSLFRYDGVESLINIFSVLYSLSSCMHELQIRSHPWAFHKIFFFFFLCIFCCMTKCDFSLSFNVELPVSVIYCLLVCFAQLYSSLCENFFFSSIFILSLGKIKFQSNGF